MGLRKFLKNRYNIVYILMILLILVLGLKMAVLTIVQGDDYRKIADIKKIKDIPIKAPRGKIYDRNGILLADNISSFTVQMYTDQIQTKDFNNVSYVLSKILDENEERLIDEFPIELDKYEYNDDKINKLQIDKSEKSLELSEHANNITVDNEKETNPYKTAQDKIIKLVNGNLYEWLNYDYVIYGETFNPKKKVLDLLKKDFSDIPIDLVNEQFVFIKTTKEIKVNENENKVIKQTDPIKIWLEKNKINVDKEPNQVVIELFSKENKYIFNLFCTSKIRKFSYEFLNSKSLINDIKLVEYSFVQDDEFKNIKRDLNTKYSEITETSLAKDDFVFLTMKYSIDNFLQTIYETDTNKIIPGKILYDKLKEIYPDLPVKFVENGEFGVFKYSDETTKNKYLNEFHLNEKTIAYDLIKELGVKNYDILYKIITDDNLKYYAQLELLKFENPYISIADWEYSAIRDKKIWINKNLSSFDKNAEKYTAEEIFNLIKESIEIDTKINDYDLRNMLVIRERYNKNSYLSYHPVDIAYGISDKSVAMISERSYELIGINVEIEPIRYYPQYSLAAHVLGYLGKISQDYEINDYVAEKGYSPDDIIGKSGIEQKFENYLRGENGKKTVEVNNVGKTIKSVSSQAPIPGDDLYLTIDINLQKKAEESLQKGLELIQTGGTYESEWGDFTFREKYKNATSGALVALDVKTGEVLALANYPSYDLNLFATGITNENWNSLLNSSKDPLSPKPLYNIALLSAIQPGSTFKMVTALAALEKGVDPNTKVFCAGTAKVGDRYFSCWSYTLFGYGHGWQNMYEAIQNSCNFYFYTTVLGENPATHQKHTVSVGSDGIIEEANKLGLNDKTGIEIDIPQEFSGGVPSIEGKKESTKINLNMFLETNIDKYVEEGYEFDDSIKSQSIDEIVSWVDKDEVMTRGEVYESLKALKLDADKVNENNISLGDILKYSYINQAEWNVGDKLNMSIGQGSNSYSTIQMANYVSIISNGGYKRNISVVKDLRKYNGVKTDYVPKRESERIELKDYDYLEIIKEGMKRVSKEDSARPYANFPVEVGSKTGTAQKDGTNPETGEPYDEFAWYVAFAPFDDPQIAVAVVLFQGGSGRYSTPIARDVIGEYLKIAEIIND